MIRTRSSTYAVLDSPVISDITECPSRMRSEKRFLNLSIGRSLLVTFEKQFVGIGECGHQNIEG